MKGHGKTHIDSPFTGMAPVPSVKGSAGCYDHHPNVGPGAADSTIPLKFMDESIPGTHTKPVAASMTVHPASSHKS